MKTVAVVIGSVREGSLNQKLGRALAKLAEGKLSFQFVQIGDLPMYKDDLWKSPPGPVLRFKSELEAADAALLLTPEYNRSTSPLMKNAIDWGSRPYGKSSWAGKRVAIAGASPGVIGSAVAQAHLRAVMAPAGAVVLTLPEVYFNARPGLIDDNDDITDAGTQKFLMGYVDAFTALVNLDN